MKIGVYCINKYRTGEYQADLICKALRDTKHTTTRLLGSEVDAMIVINGVYKEDTMDYTNGILNKINKVPTLFLINEKRAEVPEGVTIVASQYMNTDGFYFQLSSVALFDDRFDDIESRYNEHAKMYDFVYWGHKKLGRASYENKYCKSYVGNLLIGDWGDIPYQRDLDELHRFISTAKSTVIFGDEHDNENNTPLRIYEALMCGTLPFFDKDFLANCPDKWRVSKREDIPDVNKKMFKEFIRWFLPDGINTACNKVTAQLMVFVDKLDKPTKSSTDALLSQRGSIYGSYEDGVNTRASIIESLEILHKQRHNKPMPGDMKIMFGDLVLKMMRAVQGPEHQDSWDDLAGYSKLIKDVMEKRNVKK